MFPSTLSAIDGKGLSHRALDVQSLDLEFKSAVSLEFLEAC
jgi:hypothetical protein